MVYPELRRIRSWGVRVWYDEGIDPGAEWPESVARALYLAAAVVVMLTPQAAASADVRREVNTALSWGKPLLAVHLARTDLPKGMQLQLGSVQAVLRWQMDDASYARKLERTLRPYADPGGSPGGEGPGASGAAAGRVVWLAPRPAMLAGRESLLAEVDARLNESTAPWPRVIALHGLGGTGKTSVALEYAHRHQSAMRVVWQFAAEDPVMLADGFGRLAAQLGVGTRAADSRDPVASVHAALAEEPLPWLLIFDNAPDAVAAREFVPAIGHGFVLITSQSAIWPPRQGAEVRALGTGVAAKYLSDLTGDPDGHSAAELAAELGGLPLALEQAGAYTYATGSTLSGYLGLFRQHRMELLARGEVPDHPATVEAILGLALSRLAADSPAAVALLRLLAFLAPEPVPLSLLLEQGYLMADIDAGAADTIRTVLADGVAAADAVAALRRYSLITPAANQMLVTHRLVQTVLRHQLAPDQVMSWRRAAAGLIEAAIPSDPDLPASWAAFAVLLPHVLAAVDEGSPGMARTATYLGHTGNYAAATDLFIKIVLRREAVLGAEHTDTLDSRGDLAVWIGSAGDYETARDQLTALLPDCERILGTEHSITLTTREWLAHWIGETGDAAAARDMLAELIKTHERLHGTDHRPILVTRANLASWTGEAGNPAAARDMYAELLPEVERALGAENPETLSVRNNIARWTGEAGNAGGARDLYARLLPDVERILGAEHPDTILYRSRFAAFTGEAGDAAAARRRYEVLLPVIERVLGADHQQALKAREALVRWTEQDNAEEHGRSPDNR